MSLENRTFGLIEDDPIMGESLAQRLKLEGAKVRWWRTGAEALQGLSEATADAVICDIRLPDRSGADVFRSISRGRSAPPFLFITGFGDVEQAVSLMREGARDYLTKPFVMSDFLVRLEQVVGSPDTPGDAVLGVSEAMRSLEQFLQRAARVNSNLLLTGETGVGKEVCARFLHSHRENLTAHSWPSTARRSQLISWKASYSVTKREPSPGRMRGTSAMPSALGKACSFSMRSASLRRSCRPNCYG
jgi:DNA-binding NtrC family response regulator